MRDAGIAPRRRRDHLLEEPGRLSSPRAGASTRRVRRAVPRRPARAVRGQLGAARPGAAHRRRVGAELRVQPTLVSNVVGLTPALIGEHTPAPEGVSRRATCVRPLDDDLAGRHLLGAVDVRDRHDCRASTASSATAGTSATRAGLAVAAVEPARDRAKSSGTKPSGATQLHRRPSCSGGTTCTRAADISVTPRPMYTADGRKLPDVYTDPPELRAELQRRARHVSAVQLLGARAPTSAPRSWIAQSRAARDREERADADARLPAAPRLRPAALRPERPAHRARPCARSTPCAAS